MYGRNFRLIESRYESPSALRRQRGYYALQGRWSVAKARLCDAVDRTRFEATTHRVARGPTIAVP